jgi:TolB-like protein/Tfp pilus assembly protein PilF
MDQVLAFEPNDAAIKVQEAFAELNSKADTRPLHQMVDSIRATNPAALPSIAGNWFICALAERDAAAAKDALTASGENPISFDILENIYFNRPFVEGGIARMTKDDARARTAFAAARAEQEKLVRAGPDNAGALCVLGLIDAALGRKEEALREGRHAVELLPVEKDAHAGPQMHKYLAMIAAWVGDKDLACEQLAIAIRKPSGLSYGQLKLLPFWDPLRGDPRFEKLVEEAKQPIALINSPAPEETLNIASEKSIAVLPFESRSSDPDNAYFAEGIQDEIRTRLSKIADLKVISRTSTQHYKSAPENLPEIARQLGVANILEGSVQKSGDSVRVNVQLIKAASDSHLWADTFDRKLTDIFSVESEVAKAIADQLRAKLTGPEEQVIAAKSTNNTEAYDAYLRGLAYTLKTLTPASALAAQNYLKEAVRLDPKFAHAWALLSYTDSIGYIALTLQPTVALREEARQAAKTALTLMPNLGEGMLAKGQYHYGCLKDYEAAVRCFEQARPLLPNDSRIPQSLASVTRRQGQWDRSESYLKEAERLDPRNVVLLSQHALSHSFLRRFPEAKQKLDQVLDITPADVDTLATKAAIAQAEGDLPAAAALLSPLHPSADLSQALEQQVYQAILQRQPVPMITRLKQLLAKPDPALGFYNGELRFYLGWAQEVGGDHATAQESWRQARSELEGLLTEQPENHSLIADLALTNMGLGDKAAAFAFVEKGIAVVPIEKDAVDGTIPMEILARVAAQMGEPDRAIAALQKILLVPGSGALAEGIPLTPALLRLDPTFDPLRNDSRFQELAAPAGAALSAPTQIPEKSILGVRGVSASLFLPARQFRL